MAVIAAGCSSDSGSSSATAAPAGTASAAAALTISNSNFAEASVAAGTTFTIANTDTRPHTVTDDAGSFDVSIPAGGTATLSIPTAGTYKIHCKLHSLMHGTITVT